MDAIELLQQDHRAVERLFDAYEAAASDQQRGTVLQRLVGALFSHAELEERTVYALARRLALDDADVAGNLAEHMAARRTLADLERLPATDMRQRMQVAQLRREIDYHVRAEETDFLPALRAALDAGALDELRRAMEEARPGMAPGAAALDEASEVAVIGRRGGILGRLRERVQGAPRGLTVSLRTGPAAGASPCYRSDLWRVPSPGPHPRGLGR